MEIHICRPGEHSQRHTKNYKYTIDWQCKRLRLKDIKDLSSKLWFEKEDLLAQCKDHESEWSFIY